MFGPDSSKLTAPLLLSVRDVNGTKDSWIIKVKVILLWKQTFKNNQISSLDMILMDEEGNKIQATVKKNLLIDFDSLFEEGCIREITNFGTTSNIGEYMLVNHDLKIIFYKTTKVRVVAEFQPINGVEEYYFPTFSNLLKNNIDKRIAFDIVGHVVNTNGGMQVTYEYGKEKRLMTVEIEDLRGEHIQCALWGDFAQKLHTYISESKDPTAPVIILLRMAKLKEWFGKPQVSNCLFGSKLYINDDIHPLLIFKESLLAKNVGESSSTKLTLLSSKTVVTKAEDYYLRFPIKNIKDISKYTANTGLTMIATIISIQDEEGWYYFSCRTCGKKVNQNDGGDGNKPFQCDECGGVSDVYGKVRVVIRVQDETATSSFVLFERHITSLIHRSSAFLVDKINKDEGRQVIPDEFSTLINRKFVFKIQISIFNIENNYLAYTVHKLTDDEHVIDAVCKHSAKNKEIVLIDDETSINSIKPTTKLGKRMIENVDDASVLDCSSSKTNEPTDTLKIPKMEKLE